MSHLDLNDSKAYDKWVDFKKAAYELREQPDFPLVLDIEPNGDIPSDVFAMLARQIKQYNFALYRLADAPNTDHAGAIKHIGSQMGLKELDKNLCAMEDRLTKLTVQEQGTGNRYIPYSNKAIKWHNDGYYNPMHQRVLAVILHCQQPSESGGENDLLDQDMAYIHLRNENPAYIRALSDPKVMCIPENIDEGELIRPQTCSAVFMTELEVDKQGKEQPVLAMRYTQRKHNIMWRDDSVTREALDCLDTFLQSDSPYHVRYRLNPGEGVIGNNVLHTRSAFSDSETHKRVYYRARYYNRITL